MAKEFCKYYSINSGSEKVGEIVGSGGDSTSHTFFIIKPLDDGENYITRYVYACKIIRKGTRKKDEKP